MTELLETLWNQPIYQVLLMIIIVEFTLMAVMMVGLAVRVRRRDREAKAFDRLHEEHRQRLLSALDGGAVEEIEAWRREMQEYPRRVVRRFLFEYLLSTQGDFHERLAELYRQMGFLDEDLEDLEGPRWRRRVAAMRRLYVVADEREHEALARRRDDRQIVRLLAAQTLARLGYAEDVVEMLRDLHFENQLLEQPLRAMLHAMDRETFESVLGEIETFTSERVRKILLIIGAERSPDEALEALRRAAKSEHLELRIGAAIGAGRLADEASRELLEEMLEDEAWEVRAQAAKSLGLRKNPASLEALEDALADGAFWVRQNVARALRRCGAEGRERLERIVSTHEDPFAVDSARQELQRHELQRNWEGGRL